ncbi:MAG: class I SAM-dependent methyltransferase [Planctomycetes bacterium]|nr:class I SAM-dependent methyltransferase [Planctomycetota bacterium]
MRQRWADYRVFWREFRQQYHTTGALLPSGRALAFALARFVRDGAPHVAESAAADSEMAVSPRLPHASSRRILEVGPGTGAVTGQIIRAMRPSDRLFLVERNEQFVAQLRARLANDPTFASVTERIEILHASVEDLPENEPYDLIISGLPLNNFSVDSVARIFAKLRRLLAPGGTLSFFEYVAVRKAKSLVSRRGERERLRRVGRLFDDLLAKHEARRDLVLANVTPAWVHHVRFRARSTEQGVRPPAPRAPPPAPCHDESSYD